MNIPKKKRKKNITTEKIPKAENNATTIKVKAPVCKTNRAIRIEITTLILFSGKILALFKVP